MKDLKRKISKLFTTGGDNGWNEDKSVLSGVEVLNIPCDKIRPNRAQPRAEFNSDELYRLAQSIKRYGIIQPLSVRKAEIDDIYDYELVAGERRLRAARLLELYSVPCVVFESDEQEAAELAVIENVMRKDLNMFELAYALKNLGEDYGLTQDEIAARFSMSQSGVANKIRLLRFSYEEQQTILSLGLTERHARALLGILDKDERLAAIYHVANFSLNVKETERYVAKLRGEADRNGEKNELPDIEKATSSVIKGIKRRLDTFSKGGKNASMEIESKPDAIELYIRIEK